LRAQAAAGASPVVALSSAAAQLAGVKLYGALLTPRTRLIG
jgi:hypothetical protein